MNVRGMCGSIAFQKDLRLSGQRTDCPTFTVPHAIPQRNPDDPSQAPPRPPNQLAKSIIDIATGQKPERDPSSAVSDIVEMLEQWELANYKPEYQFVVRQYMIGKGHSVIVLW